MAFGLSSRALRGFCVANAMMMASAGASAQSSSSRLNGESIASHAVIFTYHRVGEPQAPATNLRVDQLDTQIQELLEGGYNVLPVADILSALQAGETLADKTVGLTVDDSYPSFYANAWPRLRAANLPFTIFVATDSIDRSSPDFMTWDQLREMVASGLVAVGSQSVSHPHMTTADDARIADELTKSAARIAAEIGMAPTLFAYPYGEMSSRVREAVRKAGYAAAFGQHSGVAYAGEDVFYLPRFSVNERFGDLSRFRLAAQALPLPVGDVTPADPFLAGDNPPAFGFTMTSDLRNIDKLGCYYADQSLQVELLGERRIEVRISQPFPPGRARLNCTLPAGNDRWRWYGTQFLVPDPSGGNPPD
jgi:peptidoglycan/xylan/chitin deacetylase (PgdA/CDA1 family)